MSGTVKKVLDILSTVIVAIVGLIAVAYIILMLTGFRMYTVLSPSMEPKYKTGSVIFVKPVDPSELEAGDVITYKFGNTTATHRIHALETLNGETVFRTKGDARDDVDAVPVEPDAVIGTPVFSIPYLGKILTNITSTESGKWTMIGIGAGLVLLVLLPSLIFDKDTKSKKGEAVVAEASEAEEEPVPSEQEDLLIEESPTEEPPGEGEIET